MTFDHITYQPGVLRILDQTRLPQHTHYLELRHWREVADAVARMKIRGAPAIGIAGAYGMALAAHTAAQRGLSERDFFAELASAANEISAVRPTAVNLSWAVAQAQAEATRLRTCRASLAEIAGSIAALAKRIHDDDIAACVRIGDAGATLLAAGSHVLTHCNTGDLATGGYGTALGIIRSAWREGKIEQVFVAETRPLLQGARLTAWELQRDRIPYTLITDGMAGHFMRQGAISAVIVGADRIARNGDVANKIGTYGLAVLARAHNIPFIVAAPLSSFDEQMPAGASIPLEQRSPDEVTRFGSEVTAPPGAASANPAFDITPAEYISAIVSDAGIARPPFVNSIAALLEKPSQVAAAAGQ